MIGKDQDSAIESEIIRIINFSDGKEEALLKGVKDSYPSHWGDYLLSRYDSPSEVPANTQKILAQHSRGDNWGFFWGKTCFLILGKCISEHHVSDLKKIIKEGHYWYAEHAMLSLLELPSFFEVDENLDFIYAEISGGSFSSVNSLISIGKLQNNDKVNTYILEKIESWLAHKSREYYHMAFGLVSNIFMDNSIVREKYLDFLIDTVESDSLEMKEKYSPQFEFLQEFQARALVRVQEYDPENSRVKLLWNQWMEGEHPIKIRDILEGIEK